MVAKGDRVVAQTSMGFWVRGTVRDTRPDGSAKITFGDFDCPPWLARTQGFGEPVAWVGPERIAPLPDAAPTEPPPVGAEVIALWDELRFFHGTVAAVTGEGAAARVDVDFRGRERLPFAVTEVLRVNAASASALEAWRERDLAVGTPVLERTEDGATRHPGWIARLGTGHAYVLYPNTSHGHWLPADRIVKGGRAAERRPPPSVADLEVGARVVARWTDGKLYDGIVAAVREGRFVPEARVAFDDGSERWTPAPRVYVTEAAGERVPQDPRDAPLPDAWLDEGRVVVARASDGQWRRGTVAARRGVEVWVDFDELPTRRGKTTRVFESEWASRRELAFPPDEGARRFPASGAGVVVVTRRKELHGVEVPTFDGARAKRAIGDRLAVVTDGGGERSCAFEDVWRRDDRRAPGSFDGLEVGAQVLAERRPGLSRPATVRHLGGKKREGLVRIAWDDGAQAWVDPTRLAPLPEPEPPPPPPPEPTPPPEPPDEIRACLLGVIQRWTGAGGYRDGTLGHLLDDDARGARLPVDVGLLGVRVERGAGGLSVCITAATGAVNDPAPPPDGAMVRLAGWVRGLFARAEDPEARAARDRAWAAATFGDDAARVDRAGGALSVTVRRAEPPPPAAVDAWARAVHDRLFAPSEPT